MSGKTITIRTAKSSDAEGISAVAKAVQLPASAPPGASTEGFLIWAQPPQVYEERVLSTDHSLVALADSSVVGFLMCYPLSVLARMQAKLSYESAIVSAVLAEGSPDDLFIDQIAVLPDCKRTGVGQRMWDHLVSTSSGRKFFATISHAPVRNLASISFFSRMGWKPLREFFQKDLNVGLYLYNGADTR